MEARGLKSSGLPFRRPAIGIGLSILLFTAGCRSNCDLVEAELRTKDINLRETKEELDRQHAYNCALQRELAVIRENAGPKMPPAEASQIYTLKSIALGRQTGGLNEDAIPGDEALQVVLEPRDGDEHAIKAPGTLTVQTLEITPEGLKKPLCSWRVPPEELRRTWKSGLWSSGYFVTLPWKVYPSQEKVRVIAQFVLADGRSFEADKDVTIRLVPDAQRKVVTPVFPSDSEVVYPETTLPPPRPTSGPALDGVKAPEVESPRDWVDTPPTALIRAVHLMEPKPLR
jgi:hypothetical protein